MRTVAFLVGVHSGGAAGDLLEVLGREHFDLIEQPGNAFIELQSDELVLERIAVPASAGGNSLS